MIGAIHAITGLAYIIGVGGFSAFDVLTGWKTGLNELPILFDDVGFFQRVRLRLTFLRHHTEWFGLGLVAMAVSCGPHHLHVGIHMIVENQSPATMDTLSIIIALPFGVAWLGFRTWALFGGAGDIYVNPAKWRLMMIWVMILTAELSVVMTLVVMESPIDFSSPAFIVQTIMALLYLVIGYILWAGQNSLKEYTGKWSLAGLSLAGVFPTCAFSHFAYGVLVASGKYSSDWHFNIIDGVIGLPAACWFIWLCNRELNQKLLTE